MTWRSWRSATTDALYGPGGFYHRPEGGPGAHFRTSSSASAHFAGAVVRLLETVDEALGRPDPLDLVEVAAARGALLTTVAKIIPAALRARVRLTAVELAARPPGLDPKIIWTGSVPPLTGLLIANEWLDNVPVDVVEQAEDGPRLVEVAPDGSERLGPVIIGEDRDWLDRWWPLDEEGDRAEVGAPRDAVWAEAVGRVTRGLAVAVDYGHVREEREAGAYPAGTLTGYREGRQVAPVPDGSCDITAHVALDAVAAAGAAAGATATALTDQRAALRGLGVGAARAGGYDAADPAGWLRSLQASGEEAELVARGGLGDFGWVVHGVGVEVPAVLMGR